MKVPASDAVKQNTTNAEAAVDVGAYSNLDNTFPFTDMPTDPATERWTDIDFASVGREQNEVREQVLDTHALPHPLA